MSVEIPLILIILGMLALFFVGQVPVDLTALVALTLLIILGYINPQNAFQGFSSPTVITVIATFFITGALRRTGVTDKLGGYLYRLAGNKETYCIAIVMISASFISSFMNNLAAVTLLMPAVVALSEKSGVSPSKLLMPLSFAAILGGMNTLIGTSANMLAMDLMRQQNIGTLTFFEFTPFGILLTIAGVLFFVVSGRKLLPNLAKLGEHSEESRNLTELYKLHERLFTLQVPHNSPLNGSTLSQLHFGEELGISVGTIIREDQRIEFPIGSEKIYSDDKLIVQGRLFEFESIRRLRGIRFVSETDIAIDSSNPLLVGAIIEIKGKDFNGKSIKELQFRENYRFEIVSIEQQGKTQITDDLLHHKIYEGDKLKVITLPEVINRISEFSQFKLIQKVDNIRSFIPGRLHLISLPYKTSLQDVRLTESDLGRLAKITVLAIVRGTQPIFGDLKHIAFQEKDRLLVSCDHEHLLRILRFAELKVVAENTNLEIMNKDLVVTEAVLAPRSWLIGRTIEDINFREKYNCQVLAIWRKGNPIRSRISRLGLEFGDTLLLLGNARAFALLKKDTNFVLLYESNKLSSRSHKAPFAIASLLTLILFSAFNLLPVQIGAMLGALIAVIFGAISMEEGYKEIDWRVVAMIGSMFAIGISLQESELFHYISTGLMPMVGFGSLTGSLVILILISSLLSQFFDSSLALVLMVPFAMNSAVHYGVAPHGFIIAVTLGASIVFMTPVSHRANLLVMGVGGYRTTDYLKSGTLLTLISVAIITLMILFIYF